MQRADQVIDLLKAAIPSLREKYHIKRIGLFGSVARGQAEPQSDIDILLDFHESEDVEVVFDSAQVEEELRERISPKVNVDLYPLSNAKIDVRNNILSSVIWVE